MKGSFISDWGGASNNGRKIGQAEDMGKITGSALKISAFVDRFDR